MKYIRTKDGVWQYNEKNNSAERPNIKFQCNQLWLNIKEQDILKQANTIEELCDIFVLDNVVPCLIHLSKTKGYYYYYGDSDKKSCLMPIYEEYKIFGAIWTERGLIYVAKMNDKGELELL